MAVKQQPRETAFLKVTAFLEALVKQNKPPLHLLTSTKASNTSKATFSDSTHAVAQAWRL